MAITGINTGSGYSGFASDGGINITVGGSGRSRVDGVSEATGIETGRVSENENKAVAEEQLENQVAVSEDGDTLQISPNAVAKLDEAIQEVEADEERGDIEIMEPGKKTEADEIKLKNEKSENARKEASLKAEKRAEILKEIAKQQSKENVQVAEKQKISFAGKSDSDITRLYLEGDISKSDYDSVMADREKLRAQTTEKDSDFVAKTSDSDKKEKRVERFGNALRTAFSNAASRRFDAITRLDTIDAAEGIKKAEKEKERLERREVKVSYR